MPDIVLSDVTIIDVENPVANVEIITIGVPGIMGPTGPTGLTGPPNVLTIGTVSTSAPGDPADASISGTAPNQVLNLTLPQGPQGPPGAAGLPPTLSIGTVTTGAPGTGASVSIDSSGAPAYVLSFTIPQGANGGGVVVGGAVGDLLIKNSTTDFDTAWTTPAVAATVSTIMKRDAAGRASVVDPSASTDIATKNYVDGKTWPSTAISDSTATGRSVLTAASTTAARTAIGAGTSSLVIGTTSTTAKAGDYQPTAANISDSTTVGRAVLTAVDAAAGRTAIGAGTSSLVIGTTNTTAKAGDYQPTSANITDAASAATASVVIKRDSAGRAQVVDPSVAADISTKNYTDTQDAAMRRPQLNTQTASYTLALTDESKLVQMNSASATTVTVPPNSSVSFAVGSVVDVQMFGTGSVTIAPGAGVTLDSPGGLTITRQFAVIRLQKIATDTWTVMHAGVGSATSLSTVNTFMLRDSAGRASVVDPSASTDISTKNYTDTQDAAMRRPVLNTQTASYTLVLTDERKLVQMNSASATTVTVPPNSSVAFSVGAVIDVQMIGAGNVTITAGAGVTINAPDSLAVMSRQYAVVRLQKTATDTWVLQNIGAASAASASTVSTFMRRDSAGRASVVDPSASTDIATKNYVDTRTPKITPGTTAPSSPATNDVWIDTN
jgi:hypothetical protein